MKTARLTGFLVALLLVGAAFPFPLFAGALDDYYLARFGETGQKISAAVLAQSPRQAERCGTPLYRNLRKDWPLLEPATRTTLAKYLALPLLSGPEGTILSPSGRFKIHYTTTGADAATSLWAMTTAQIFDAVYAAEAANSGTAPNLGYLPAPTRNSAPYDVYLQDLASLNEYGHTHDTGLISGSSVSAASYIVVDRSFTNSLYSGYPPLESLQVTAAHEYHHAIQFGYNFYFDLWYAEATSTWMEEEIYDGVNQLYTYLSASLSNPTLSLDTAVSTTTGGGYGRWLFNRYLAEQHGVPVVRKMWERLATLPAPANGADIPMTPVLNAVLIQEYSTNLSTDFFGYAKRLYSRAWQSHTTEIDYIPRYVPTATYVAYPVTTSSIPAPSITLPHYSYAYIRLPATASGVTVTISRDSGMELTAFRAGAVSVEYPPAQSTLQTTIFIPPTPTSTEIVLLVCNATAMDNLSAAFTTDGSIPVLPASGGSSGGGGGCFIATAAYGSYLAPEVHSLREFRDRVLLSGRAGRGFVTLYYRLSPPVADFIRKHEPLRAATRIILTPLLYGVAHPLAALLGFLTLTASGIIRFRQRRSRSAVSA